MAARRWWVLVGGLLASLPGCGADRTNRGSTIPDRSPHVQSASLPHTWRWVRERGFSYAYPATWDKTPRRGNYASVGTPAGVFCSPTKVEGSPRRVKDALDVVLQSVNPAAGAHARHVRIETHGSWQIGRFELVISSAAQRDPGVLGTYAVFVPPGAGAVSVGCIAQGHADFVQAQPVFETVFRSLRFDSRVPKTVGPGTAVTEASGVMRPPLLFDAPPRISRWMSLGIDSGAPRWISRTYTCDGPGPLGGVPIHFSFRPPAGGFLQQDSVAFVFQRRAGNRALVFWAQSWQSPPGTVRNSFGRAGYTRPCPPRGTQSEYEIRVYALRKRAHLEPGDDAGTLIAQTKKFAIAGAALKGVYRRP